MTARRTLLAAILTGSLAGTLANVSAGPTGDAGSLEYGAEREIARRQDNIVIAQDQLRQGDAALAAGDVQAAYEYYKSAVNNVPDGSSSGWLRGRAISRYSATAVRYAEYLVSQGEYAKAEAVAREVLDPLYNPNYRPAAVFLTHLEQPDYFNKTITPEFAAERSRVEDLLNQANGYFDSGRFELALKKYQEVLALDKYNAAALRGMEQVELGKQRYFESAYNETRSRMLYQVDKAWERPKRTFVDGRTTDSESTDRGQEGTEKMHAKLESIIIPSLDIRNKSIEEAVDIVRKLSRENDRTSDAGDNAERGVDIVLQLGANAPAPKAANLLDSPSAPSTINLRLTDVPLNEVIRYLATLSGLKWKVESNAVWIVPHNSKEATETPTQRTFKVPPGFIPTESTAGNSETTYPGPGGGTSNSLQEKPLGRQQNAKDFLTSLGVQFNDKANAIYSPGSGQLFVVNTKDELDYIESLLQAAMSEQPTLVEIESKFVEISQNTLKELGFDWTLGPFSIGGSGTYGAGGSPNASGFPFVNPATGEAIGNNNVTSGLRSGSGVGGRSAVSVNSVDNLITQALGTGTAGAAPGIFGISGIFTNPQFQFLIRALNQQKGVDLMAAPKVTTKNNQKAEISISRQFPYPQSYEPPQIPSNSGPQGNNNNGTIIGTPTENDPIVTPSFPTDFDWKELGVKLVVTPQINSDGRTIDMELEPSVVDFDGFINYGSPIYSPVTVNSNVLSGLTAAALALLNYDSSGRHLMTENTINQPIFSTRKVSTKARIWDGQTVALGGLIREDVQKVNDKVPILGDIPIAGTLFRSSVDQKLKKNLIIFVTARLMDPSGQPLRPLDENDQEEIVEPLGTPRDLQKPNLNAKGFRQK